MFNNFNCQDDMNNIASDAIHSYIKDGYRIDAAESIVDSDIDKGCTFKAVLKKNENDTPMLNEDRTEILTEGIKINC